MWREALLPFLVEKTHNGDEVTQVEAYVSCAEEGCQDEAGAEIEQKDKARSRCDGENRVGGDGPMRSGIDDGEPRRKGQAVVRGKGPPYSTAGCRDCCGGHKGDDNVEDTGDDEERVAVERILEYLDDGDSTHGI